ncbi:integral membrane protein [Xylariales sp. PMI_506]|nr:integral membrane protein [Xylariales sp. PMI_506]
MGWVENASPEVSAQSEYRLIFGICISLSILSITIVSSRLWLRHKARGLAADDMFAGLAMLFALIYSITCMIQTKYGLGLPLALRPTADLTTYGKVNFIGRPFYQLGISFFKISLLISYLSLVRGTHHTTYQIVIWISIALIGLGHLICMFLLIFNCDPIYKSWDSSAPGSCFPFAPANEAYSSVTIMSDVWVTLVPIPILARLNMKNNKKFGLVAIFMLGLFTTICSVLRFLQINRIAYGDGNSTMLVLWGTIEFNVGNIVSSLPYVTPAYLRKARGYISSSKDKSGAQPHSYFGKSGHPGYQLSDMMSSKPKGRVDDEFGSVSGDNESEENILRKNEAGAKTITKSVTYTVNVVEAKDAEFAGRGGPMPGI